MMDEGGGEMIDEGEGLVMMGWGGMGVNWYRICCWGWGKGGGGGCC